MKTVYAIADSIFSPIANSSEKNFEAAANLQSSIGEHQRLNIFPQPFFASLFGALETRKGFTRFESLCIEAITTALQNTNGLSQKNDTVFILSSTKGNIELLENKPYNRAEISLYASAKKIAAYFNISTTPIVVSNACISGVVAINLAQQMLSRGQYKHAIVCGADVLSKFIISGFHALGAASNEACKPFDKNRKGINLGECAATIILSTDHVYSSFSKQVTIGKGFSSNDANHISGPSKTGAELAFAIQNTISENNINTSDISFVNAHGTGTIFNDEMEAKAFGLCHIQHIPTNSLKAILGHTLGAAGVAESILSYHALLNNCILPSKNFSEMGTSVEVNINTNLTVSQKTIAIKTASGFGGCNAATAFKVRV